MLRIIVRTQDVGSACNVEGATADISFDTFEIDAPALETFLNVADLSYTTRRIIGSEVIADTA